jgi:spore maturation protein CgeB
VHREIFDADGKTVVYFRSIPEMLERGQWLLSHEQERLRLASTSRELITNGKNTYAHRLRSMLGIAGCSFPKNIELRCEGL